MNPNNKFDMHTINRLIMREQIPGFQMLPKEQKLLAEYREALMEYHNYTERDKNADAKRDEEERLARIEARKAAVKAKKANKKHADRSEQPISEETTETEPEQHSSIEMPTEEIVTFEN